MFYMFSSNFFPRLLIFLNYELTSGCTLALQGGLYGSSLVSQDNTVEQNSRMISVSTALNHHKNILLRQSVQRYEITNLARGQINSEFSKSILDTDGVPELFQAGYRERLLSLQQGVNTRFASLIHDLGTSEHRLREEVDCMYASATNALAGELEEHRAHSNALRSVHGDIAASPLVRQNAASLGKRSRSSSPDSARSDSTLAVE